MKISSGSKHGDIRRVLWTVRTRMQTSTTPRHVKAHQDDFVDRSTLSLPAQLNCFCDDLAKRAVNTAILSASLGTGRLPLEHAALSINGDKQTTDVCKGIRHHIGRRAAKAFFLPHGKTSSPTSSRNHACISCGAANNARATVGPASGLVVGMITPTRGVPTAV